MVARGQKTLAQFAVEQPEIPAELAADYLELARAGTQAAQHLVSAVRAFFRDITVVPDHIHKVYFYEKEADKLADRLKRRIFSMDVELARKIHLRYFCLHVENISELTLTDAGRMAVRTGSLKAIYAVFDRERYASPQHFEQSLAWLCLLWARYKSSPFCLLQLRVTNAAELSLRIGRSAMVLLLEEFARRLRAVIRDTDVAARLQEERITLLMPFTNTEQARKAVQRLGDVSGGFQPAGEERLLVAWGLLGIPDDATGKEGHIALLARLAGLNQGIL